MRMSQKGLLMLLRFGVLQSLFAIFMGRSKLKHRKPESMTVQEEEERVVSVISNLLTVRRFLELFRNMNRKSCCMMPPLLYLHLLTVRPSFEKPPPELCRTPFWVHASAHLAAPVDCALTQSAGGPCRKASLAFNASNIMRLCAVSGRNSDAAH